MLGNLLYQTRPPDETLVFVSEVTPPVLAKLREQFPHARFHACPDRNDWGHEKRALGLALASKDFVGFFNDDDSYDLTYIEKLLRTVQDGYDAAFCSWNGNPGANFSLGSSTSGNFIVRTKLAQEIGYPVERDEHGRIRYESDGRFIEGIRANGLVAPRINEILYRWNVQP